MSECKCEVQWPVRLADDRYKTFWSLTFVHWLIERLIFFKFQKFKNDPRFNYLLVRAALGVLMVLAILFIVCMIGLCFLYGDLDHEWRHADPTSFSPILMFQFFAGYAAAVSLVFWNSNGLLNRKWQYCCELYNKMLVADGLEAELLANSLAIDLVIIDFWAHRSFRELFAEELTCAIKYFYNPTVTTLKTFRAPCGVACESDLIKFVNEGSLKEGDAQLLLEDYQRALLSKSGDGSGCPTNPPTQNNP